MHERVLDNPQKLLDPRTGDLLVLSKSRKPIYRRPIFWIGVGAVVGGTVGALLATEGGAIAAPATGSGGVGVGLGGF